MCIRDRAYGVKSVQSNLAAILMSTTPLSSTAVSYTHLRAHETPEHRGWRLVREKKEITE